MYDYLPPMQPEKVEEQTPNTAENAKVNPARVNSRRSTLQPKYLAYTKQRQRVNFQAFPYGNAVCLI